MNNEEKDDCYGMCIPKDVSCNFNDDCKSIGHRLSGVVFATCKNSICEYYTVMAIS